MFSKNKIYDSDEASKSQCLYVQLLKNRIQPCTFEDLVDFTKQFVNWEASQPARKRVLQGLYKMEGFYRKEGMVEKLLAKERKDYFQMGHLL